ncbi:MAG: hypothetical protein ACKV0T_12735, partial [Planctomycetales bacterium]
RCCRCAGSRWKYVRPFLRLVAMLEGIAERPVVVSKVTLGRLLKERVIADPIDGGRNDGNDLGRILFERGPGRAVTWLLWLAPLKGVGVVVGSLVATWWGRPEWLTIGGVTALVLFLLWGVALSQATRLTCHERGAAWRWLWRVRRLMFANVANVTFQTVRQYVKGVYSGTTFTLSLEGEEEGQPVKLRFARTLRSADPELEHVRDHVSRLIATRMAQSLAEGQRVAWTSRLALLRDGLEYRAPSLLAKKPPVTYRYDQLTGIDASGELFQAWVGGRRTPAIRESTGDPNFYPGYLLLVRILAARKPTELRQTVSPL